MNNEAVRLMRIMDWHQAQRRVLRMQLSSGDPVEEPSLVDELEEARRLGPLNPGTGLSMGEQFVVRGDTARVEIWYPRSEDRFSFVEVGLVDVRAADTIRVSYDFERDGYKIEQASKFEWPAEDEVCDPDWQEVAYVAAWGREEKVSP